MCFAPPSDPNPDTDTGPASDGAEGDKALSEECRSFANQPDADLGDVLEAGCEPTLAQMSKLMDNPVGNVAMLFTQYDSYHLENDANGETGIQGVYMGIAQFPKKLNENWNLINRVVWTVPSLPLDQDKIDDFDGGDYGNIPPLITPPSGKPAPIDLFGGRTTGFGDLYYVGLFSPAEGIKLDNGANFVWGLGDCRTIHDPASSLALFIDGPTGCYLVKIVCRALMGSSPFSQRKVSNIELP